MEAVTVQIAADPSASEQLAQFAAALRYEDIPPAVIARAKDCIVDTVGACTYGARFAWSQAVLDYARRYGSRGDCDVLMPDTLRVQAPFAALANGALAHAFEQDCIREPGMGVHAGATIMPAALAAAQEAGADGRALLRAFVAGCEVASRIGVASQHSPEKLGFHAPGLTGPFGAAVAAGLLMGLDGPRLVDALGIAGSLTSGLLAFSKSRRGAMVKRLHPGRAAESGVMAARLAASGYAGPESILEGRFGFLEAYCNGHPTLPSALTAGLGQEWETLRTSLKRYACHVNAHTAVQATRELVNEHAFSACDVVQISVEGHERLAGRHDIREPADLMKAQYSIPFCVAVALHRDPDDPRSFDDSALADVAIRATCRQVEVRVVPALSVKSTRVTLTMADGRVLTAARDTYRGMPAEPLDAAQLRSKFMRLTTELGAQRAASLFERLHQLENQASLSFA
jgi:2-methylcitrate dehydratase PrpD